MSSCESSLGLEDSLSSNTSDRLRQIGEPAGVERIVIYNKAEKTSESSASRSQEVDMGERLASNRVLTDYLKTTRKAAPDRLVETADDEGTILAKKTFHKNVSKYVMSLGSEKRLYITGATLLTMNGLISFEEYTSNKYKKNIRPDILEKKFYLSDVLGAIRGLARLKLSLSKDRLPSITMFKRMKEEDDELVASGYEFVSDSDGSNSDGSDCEETGSSSALRNAGAGKKAQVKSSRVETARKKTGGAPVQRVGEKSSKPEALQTGPADDSDNALPQELLQCGVCGISITSLQHLDRHLERCRGTKRKLSTDSSGTRKKFNLDQSENLPSGKLFVYASEDGEVIDGWGPSMGAIPPGPTCPRCAYEVPTLYDLPLHQRHHTGEDEITCAVCPYSTKSILSYLLHVEDHATY